MSQETDRRFHERFAAKRGCKAVFYDAKDGTPAVRYDKIARVKEAMYAAFAEEVEKEKTAIFHYIPLIVSPKKYVELAYIAKTLKEKNAGFMSNLGSRIRFSNVGRASESLLRNPLNSMKQGVRATFRDPKTRQVGFMSKGNRLMPGLFLAGTAMSAKSALQKDNPDKIGPGRGERVGKFLGGTLTGLAATPYGGIGAGLAMGMVGDTIGGRVGRIADRMRGYKAQKVPPQQPIQNPQQAQPQQAPPIRPQPQGVA